MHNRIASDENFKASILNGLRRALPGLVVFTAQSNIARGTADIDVLSWAASNGCILLTHDSATMEAPAYERVAQGLPMPGVFIVPWDFPIGHAVEQLVLAFAAGRDDEWTNAVVRLPLRV